MFDSAGTLVRAFDHESPLSPFRGQPAAVRRSLLEGFPDALGEHVREAAFSDADGVVSATFCAWWLDGADGWSTGSLDDDGGAARLLELVLDGSATAYRDFVAGYYEIDLPLASVRAVYEHAPLDETIVLALNPEADAASVLAEAGEMGYPT